MMQRPVLVLRLLILLSVVLALLMGLGAGLARLGVVVDAASSQRSAIHGPLMIFGVLGVLISTERAVALAAFGRRYRLTYFVPLSGVLGTLLLLFGGDSLLGKSLLMLTAFGLVAIFGLIWRRHPAPYIAIMAFGALAWWLGALLWWLGQPIYQAVHWWIAFLVLTIIGERLELSRLRRLAPLSQRLLSLLAVLYLAALALTVFNLDSGLRLVGLILIALSLWLLRFDIVSFTIRRRGLPRYVAICLFIGYIWLLFAGAISLAYGAVYVGAPYSLLLHSVLLGFVFSMIFGHAPIILPALTGLQVTFQPLLYAPLALLHLSLLYRAYGALSGELAARQLGGVGNALAILLFLALMARTLWRARRSRIVGGAG